MEGRTTPRDNAKERLVVYLTLSFSYTLEVLFCLRFVQVQLHFLLNQICFKFVSGQCGQGHVYTNGFYVRGEEVLYIYAY